MVIPGGWTEDRSTRFEEAEIDAEQKNYQLKFKLSSAELKKNRELITAVIHEVVAAQGA